MSRAARTPTDSLTSPAPDALASDTDDVDDAGDEADTPSVYEVHELLRNPRRRFIVARVIAIEETDLGQLAREMAGWENEKDPEAVTSSERKRAYIALYQNHLPKLDDADVVEFDSDRGDVARGPNTAVLEEYMDLDGAGNEPSQVGKYLYLVAGGLFCYGVSALLLGPVGVVQIALLLVTLLAVATLAAVEDVRSSDSVLRSQYAALQTLGGELLD